MTCPYFLDGQTAGARAQCIGVAVPFEPSSIEQIDYCTTGRFRSCLLYRNAGRDLALAIHREVVRALG